MVGTSIEPPYNLHMAMDSSWNGPRGAPALRQVQTPQGGRSKSLWRARESGMMIVYWCLLIVNRSNMIVDDVDVHVHVVVDDDVVDDYSLLIVKHAQTWSN